MFVSVSLDCGHEVIISYRWVKGKYGRLEAYHNDDNDKGIPFIRCPHCGFIQRGSSQ